MPSKFCYKKDCKNLYLPGKAPAEIIVPEMRFIMVDGHGAPEGDDYQEALAILYALSFTIKMSKMAGQQPQGYYEYDMLPLEGLWQSDPTAPKTEGVFLPGGNRNQWLWTSMIRQPDFVTEDVFAWAVAQAAVKKPGLPLRRARLETWEEGLCVQIMHTGPYATEPASLAKMEQFIKENSLASALDETRRHHEIYLTNPQRTKPDNLKTILRHPCKRV